MTRFRLALLFALLGAAHLQSAFAAQLPPVIDPYGTLPEGVRVMRLQGLQNQVLSPAYERPQTVDFGDVNGDGFDDLVFTATSISGEDESAAMVIVWGNDRPAIQVDLEVPEQVAATVLRLGDNARPFPSICCGDFDGDRFDDVLMGLPSTPNIVGQVSSGEAHIIWGRPEWADGVFSFDASEEELEATHFISGYPGAHLGHSVSAGDLNSDGTDEAIITAPLATHNAKRAMAGLVYILGGTPDLRGETVELSGEGSPGALAVIEGRYTLSHIGISTAVGDVNGDGIDDLIIGNPNAGLTSGNHFEGEAIVFYGSTSLPTLMDLAQPKGTYGETWIHPTDRYGMLGTSVACGDLNGDGFDDVIAGQPEDYASPIGVGEVDVIWGSPSLPGQVLTVQEPHGDGISTFHGVEIESKLGTSVAVGDIDGDGCADLMMGAPWVALNGNGYGVIDALHGGPDLQGVDVDLATTPADVEMIGWTHDGSIVDYFGYGAVAGGDFDRDGVGEFGGTGSASPQVVIAYGLASAEVALANEYFPTGDTPRRGFGGRLSPTVRTWLAFNGGSGATFTTAGVVSGDSQVQNLGDGTLEDVADAVWWIQTLRTGYASAEVTLQYTDREVSGLDEKTLLLWQSENLEGPWLLITEQSVNPHRNEIVADTPALGFFTITGELAPPDPNDILEYLLGIHNDPAGLNINGDAVVDVGDFLVALNHANSEE